MNLSFGGVLKSALIAGLIASLVVAGFHFFVTEPIIEQAIGLEALSHADMEPEVVSREMQRVGLFVGFLLYGLTWSLLFSVAFQLTRNVFPKAGLRQRSIALAAAMLWGVCLLPFLKYPANPPGVGEADTIAFRQQIYVGMLILSIAGTAAAALLGEIVSRRSPLKLAPWAAAIGFSVLYAVAVCLLMPANPDPVKIPTWLVDEFRQRSVVGLALFWVTLGPAFAFLAERSSQSHAVPIPRPT